MNTTRWTAPCGCVMDYSWDPEQPEDVREHHTHTTVKSCETHAHHKKCKDRYDAMIGFCRHGR